MLDSQFPNGEGVVKAVVMPGIEWRVRIHGTYWKARAAASSYDFISGDPVRSVAREGLTLLIEPA